MNQPGIRHKRLGASIQKHLSFELARELTDPRLSSLSIESVEMTPDLGLATVRVRLMIGDTEETRGEALRALRRVGPMLRSKLAPILKMRRVPEIRFFYDEGADHSRRIEEVLEEIRTERDEPND